MRWIWGVWHVWGTGEMHTEFWCEDLRERDHLKGIDIDGRIILKLIFQKLDGAA